MPVEILRGHLMSLKVEMNKPFMGSLQEENIICVYECVDLGNDVILYHTMMQKSKEVMGDFCIQIQMQCEYKLSPKNIVTAEHLYECAKMTKEHLNSVFASIFSMQKAFIKAEIPPFEAEIDKIFYALSKMIH